MTPPLDCEGLVPFDVFRVPVQFDGDPDLIRKIFIVARNVIEAEVIRCFKPTSQTVRYEDPLVLKGVVEYKRGEVSFFTADHTFVDPEPYAFSYRQLRTFHRNGQFEYLDTMPGDFRQKMERAVRDKAEWTRNQKKDFFNWFTA